jgi:hypothetical protein
MKSSPIGGQYFHAVKITEGMTDRRNEAYIRFRNFAKQLMYQQYSMNQTVVWHNDDPLMFST